MHQLGDPDAGLGKAGRRIRTASGPNDRYEVDELGLEAVASRRTRLSSKGVALRGESEVVVFDPNLFRPDLTITNIEITQAIQCLNSNIPECAGGDNSLPVATNRSTAVRVHLKLSSLLISQQEIQNVPVRLYVKAGTGSGAEIFFRDGAGTASKNPQRTEATHSANFFLSIDGDGDIPVRMCAKVDPFNEYSESNENNNRFPATGSLTKTFEERRAIEIDGLPIDYRRPA